MAKESQPLFDIKIKYIYKEIKGRLQSCVGLRQGNDYIILGPDRSEKLIKSLAEFAINEMEKLTSSVVVAVSPCVYQPEQLPQYYHLTQKTALLGPAICPDDNIIWVEQLEHYLYLADIINTNNGLLGWAENKLKPIVSYDEDKSGDLFDTMKMLLLDTVQFK